ncbi:pentapeptide repeat-containing protein [Spirulina subsalsa FACHB-351]|uniref:Pentapeptide repeat-containing protein n=1 Tax=Spirulina subsalsa FACHB-351 TaxID=234711 RepID=A0ABT3L3H9_9CYAN|nr:pentapeptide repeat-containing protein [Spirulina subsalsa]MCW6036064.1 pentapeptide repeat-containing protein [Spirulina subsalsa FACHB-351]
MATKTQKKQDPTHQASQTHFNPSSSVAVQSKPETQPSVAVQMSRAAQFGHSVTGVPVQAQLVIGEPGDKYEKEADTVAAQAVRMKPQNTPIQRQTQPDMNISRADMGDMADMGDLTSEGADLESQGQDIAAETTAAATGEEGAAPQDMAEGGIAPEETAEMLPPETSEQLEAANIDPSSSSNGEGGEGGGDSPEARIQKAMSSGGTPLPEDDQQKLRERLKIANPEAIVIHTDPEADELCQMMSARAFTTSNHIFFANGEYGNDELLFHEATHCIQQGAVTTTDSEGETPQPEDGAETMTPQEGTESPLEEAVMTKPQEHPVIQREEAKEETPAAEAPKAEEQAPAEEESEEQKEAKAEGDAAQEKGKEDEDKAKEEGGGETQAEEEQAPTGEGGEEAGELPEQAEITDGGTEVEEANVEMSDIPEEGEVEVEVDDFSHLYFGPTKEAELPGFDEEMKDHEMFQSAKDKDPGDADFWSQFGEGYDSQALVAEKFSEKGVGVDKASLIMGAFGSGILEAALSAAISAGLSALAEKGMEAFAKKFPNAAGPVGEAIGPIMTIASFAVDPEGWWKENILVFGDHAKAITGAWSGLGEGSVWNRLASFMELILGVMTFVKQIITTVKNILDLISAIMFILGLISIGIGAVLAAFVFTAPAAPPFKVAGAFLKKGAAFLQKITKKLGLIETLITAASLPPRALAVLFRTIDIATFEGDPEELLEKQQKLKGHVKSLVADGISTYQSRDDIKKAVSKKPAPKDPEIETIFGKDAKNETDFQQKSKKLKEFEEANPNFATKVEDYEESETFGNLFAESDVQKNYGLEKKKAFEDWTKQQELPGDLAKGFLGEGGASETIAKAAFMAAGKGDDESEKYFSTDGLAGKAGEWVGGKAENLGGAKDNLTIQVLQQRIIQGAEELPAPPDDDVVKINESAAAYEDLEEEKQALAINKGINQNLKAQAAESSMGSQALIEAVAVNQAQIDQYHADVAEKQVQQDQAAALMAEAQQTAAQGQAQAANVEGMTKGQQPHIEGGMKEDAAKDVDGGAAEPEAAIGGSGQSKDDLKETGGASQKGIAGMQANKGKLAQADSAATAQDNELQGFREQKEQDVADAEEAKGDSDQLDTEIDEGLDMLQAQQDELLAERQQSITNIQMWIVEHKAKKQEIYDDLEATEGSIGKGKFERDSGDEESEDEGDGPFAGVKLSDLDLSGTNLSGIDFTEVDLKGADLSDTNLSNATLTKTQLQGADLTGADLTGADLTEADLTGATLDNATLDKAKTENAVGLSV